MSAGKQLYTPTRNESGKMQVSQMLKSVIKDLHEGQKIETIMDEFMMRDSIGTFDLRLNTESWDCLGQEYDMLFPSLTANQNQADISMLSFKSASGSLKDRSAKPKREVGALPQPRLAKNLGVVPFKLQKKAEKTFKQVN